MSKGPKKSAQKKDAPAEEARELPLAPTPGPATTPPAAPSTDADPLQRWREARELEDEMNEMFDEDRVTHKHGNAEPESD
ncbi:MAG: hypothetical protein ACOYXU_13020 [Nitrospirota bacterium]